MPEQIEIKGKYELKCRYYYYLEINIRENVALIENTIKFEIVNSGLNN